MEKLICRVYTNFLKHLCFLYDGCQTETAVQLFEKVLSGIVVCDFLFCFASLTHLR